jgi:iron complex outermembrane receptor protein
MRSTAHALTLGVLVVAGAAVHAQQPSGAATTPVPASQDDTAIRIRLPVLTVTAQKEPEEARKLPVSVTAVPKDTLDRAEVRSISDAATYAPNTFFHEFTARKLSNPRFRGVGSSPNNPGVSTYFDGVPQFNASSSSIELADVAQIEFVRGPQSTLFGRNAVGGVINVSSLRPSLSAWTGSVTGPFGNFAAGEIRASASGPLLENRLGLGASFGYAARDGFTINDVTGNDLDSRSALFGKTQLLWTPAADWEARLIVTGERARDGDYALADLDAVRSSPFHASRDVEGFTRRDIVAPTVLLRRAGRRIDVSTTTGLVWWQTDDRTDLDYTAVPLITRDNDEKSRQFTQEVRVASARNAAVALSDAVALRWQAGVFVFTQDYEQDAVNTFSPYVLSEFVGLPVRQHSPKSSLDDRGVGVYGQGTLSFAGRLDATVGVRGDRESKHASLDTFYVPAIAPEAAVDAERSFSDVSPKVSLAYHLRPDTHMVYATAARGYKAGGFNAASPAGAEAYGEESSWSYETGAKTRWFADRLSVHAALYYLDWSDLQVNLPNPLVPGQFFIANSAGATSKGVELEVNARPLAGCDFFAGFGYSDAAFDEGSMSNGLAVGGRRLANTPRYTADFGGQYTVALTGGAQVYGRAEVAVRGSYFYDDVNTESQEAFSLASFRAGARGRRLFAEAWIRNAFDTRYVPIAFAYPGLAPSGFVAEAGAPRTFGVRAGLTF